MPCSSLTAILLWTFHSECNYNCDCSFSCLRAFHFGSTQRPEKSLPKPKPQRDLRQRVGVAPQSAMTATKRRRRLRPELTFYCRCCCLLCVLVCVCVCVCLCVCVWQAACAHIKPHKKVVNSIVIWQTKHRKWAEPSRGELSWTAFDCAAVHAYQPTAASLPRSIFSSA